MDSGARIIVFLGPPGSGKGTQASRLAQHTALVPISTGELLRRESDSRSEIGERVRSLLASGLLVGNDLMNQVVAQQLSGRGYRAGCILDGYPRTIHQAQFLDDLLRQQQIDEPLVFDFVVSPEKVIERLSHRRQCPDCGKIYSAEFDVYGKDMICESDGAPLVRRSDDNPRAIRERLQIYQRNSFDLVSFYQVRRYFAVDAMQSPDEISAALLTLMSSSLTNRADTPRIAPLDRNVH